MVNNKKDLQSDDPWAEDNDPPLKKVGLIISYLNQPTYITLLITIIFYVIISTYFINYFDRLALPFYTLNLPLSFYLDAGYNILKVSLLFVLETVMIFTALYMYFSFIKNYYAFMKKKEYFSKYFKAIQINSIASTIIICILTILLIFYTPLAPSIPSALLPIYIINFLDISENYRSQLQDSPILALTIAMSGASISFLLIRVLIKIALKYENKIFLVQIQVRDTLNSVWVKPIIGIIILIILSTLITVVPARLGYYAAEDLIQGKCDYYEMNFSVADNLSNQTYNNMILITHCNNNYYLIKMVNYMPSNVSTILYIIPERIVRNATVRKCEYKQISRS